jgi:RhtB (resistance to homoserine/threonine) family protein
MNSMFFTIAVVGLLAVMSPGPDFIMVTRNSLLYSKKVGLATAFGIAVGIIWWICASVLGISYLVSRMIFLFTALKWGGALYLVYLGVKGLCAKRTEIAATAEVKSARQMSVMSAFRIGILTNVLNPKCALFFMSLFSIVVTRKTPLIYQWCYGGEIAVIALVWFSLLATILSAERVRHYFEQASVWLERVTGAILIALGVKVALYHQQ